MDKAFYRVACPQLKISLESFLGSGLILEGDGFADFDFDASVGGLRQRLNRVFERKFSDVHRLAADDSISARQKCRILNAAILLDARDHRDSLIIRRTL